ncbi:MAG: NAD(P)-dependent oxidoreductase [Alphaproteobacteria bacterium]|nr:NAD(P)-dependent oxidoreductase [Alphaproteobacteria bacterium]
MEVGYVGLGAMGGALAKRLLKSRKLRVYDLRSEAAAALSGDGAVPAQSPAALAAQSDLVLTCLPTSHEVRQAIFGENGIASGMKQGGLIADMTTGDPIATRRMANELKERGLTLIDAPVSGGPHGALAGTIAIMVGAPPALYEKVAPVFRQISPNVFHCGGVGNGHTMKLVNNVIAAGCRQVTFEAVAMGMKNGLDLKTCMDVLNKSSGKTYTSEYTLARLLDGSIKANFTIALMLKDVRLATQLGLDSEAPMPIAGLVREVLLSAQNEQGGNADINELITRYERAAKVKVANR